MDIDPKTRKKQLRQRMLAQRDKLPPGERKLQSEGICEQLWELVLSRKIRVIHSYLPMGSEVNVLPFLQRALDHGLTVVSPKTLKNRRMQHLILTDLGKLEPGIFNTYHPRAAEEYRGHYDLMVVAGLAFDHNGFRVGYGGGYYDTFLADHPEALTVGVCFPHQIVDSVPVEPHDIQLRRVIH